MPRDPSRNDNEERADSLSQTDKYFQDNEPMAGLGRASLHSGMIVVAGRLVSVASQVVSMIVLARLLDPHDFGLTATIFALIGFGPMLIDLGTSDATSQKTHISRAEVSYLFWLNTTIAVVLALLLIASGGFIAKFYNEPALSGIAAVSSLTFIAVGISTQHLALLRRAMQFRSLTILDICSNGISSVLSIVMALTGWGYWALVAKPVAMAVLTVVVAWIACPWLPGRPQQTKETNASVRFGLGVAGFTLTDTFAQSFDRLALGYFYGVGTLGYYQNAFLFYTNLINLLIGPLHNIAVSSLSKLRGNLVEFRKSWTTALSTVTFLSTLAFAVLAVTGPDVVTILLGEKWAPAGPVLCLFAIRGIAQATERTLGWLHVSTGRSDRWMRWGLLSAVCQIAAVVIGLPFGLMGVAATSAIAIYILFVPALAYAGRPAGIGAKEVWAAVGPQTVAGLIAVAVGLGVRETMLIDLSQWPRFLIASSLSLTVYLVVAIALFKVTQPMYLALSALRNFGPKRLLGNS